jgi:hypothetical protein
MAFLLGQRADSICESQSLRKIRERENTFQSLNSFALYQFPLRH